jgi:hypothetical protein
MKEKEKAGNREGWGRVRREYCRSAFVIVIFIVIYLLGRGGERGWA